MIDWESLLNDINVEWRRQGKNTSRHDINICCPFCGDDYSFHLGISLEKENAYYCFRSPDEHSGRSIPRLLISLGIPKSEIDYFIKRYDTATVIVPPAPPSLSDITRRWRKFSPLRDNKSAIQYMQDERGFEDVEELAYRFDLRCAKLGVWAQRVLFPIKQKQDVVSWSGRSIRSSLIPKYAMQSLAHPGLIYAPRPDADLTFIVEGPMDALKIAAANPSSNGIALLGKSVNASKLLAVKQLIKHSKRIIFLADKDVSLHSRMRMSREIKQIIQSGQKFIVDVCPGTYKDAGEMPLNELRKWIQWNA